MLRTEGRDPHRLLPVAGDARAIARVLYERVADNPIISPHGHVPAGLLDLDGTATGYWLDEGLATVLGITEELRAETADEIYDAINDVLATPMAGQLHGEAGGRGRVGSHPTQDPRGDVRRGRQGDTR